MPTMNDTIAKTTELPNGTKLEFYFSNANKKWQLWEIDGDKSRKVNESSFKDAVVKYANDTYSVQLKSIETNSVEDVVTKTKSNGFDDYSLQDILVDYDDQVMRYVLSKARSFYDGRITESDFKSRIVDELMTEDKDERKSTEVANEVIAEIMKQRSGYKATKSAFFDDTIYKDGTKSVTYSRTSKTFKAMDGEKCVGEYSDKEVAIKACATAKKKESKSIYSRQFGGAGVEIVMDEDGFYSVEQNGKQMANYPDKETAIKFMKQLYTDNTPYDVFSLPGGSQVKTVLAGSNTMVYKVTNGVATFLKSFSSPDKALEWVNDSYNTGN